MKNAISTGLAAVTLVFSSVLYAAEEKTKGDK